MERLTAYMDGTRAGWFTRDAGRITFDFDPAWKPEQPGIEISASLPRSRRHHTGTAPQSFLWGLLPDNDATITRWAARFGVRANNPMALLAHVGLDCAGAIQLTTEDAPTLTLPGGIDPVSGSEIAQHLRALRGDPNDWTLPAAHEGQFSLAGAQAKFTLRQTPGGWGVAWGSEPSSHIVKPGVQGFAEQDINEHLCLEAGRRVGLNTARSRIEQYEDESAIIVERFDRYISGGKLLRIHQEDFCQALGLPPWIKYQSDGGPGISRSVSLIRELIRGRQGRAAAADFVIACAFNWLITGTDAHAKNYSLLYDGRPRLAPFYDIASTLPYPRLPQPKAKLAMSVAGRYRVREIDAAHWSAQADEDGMDADDMLARITRINAVLPDAFSDAVAAMGEYRDEFCNRLVDRVAERCAAVAKELRGSSARPAAPTAPRRRAGQLRAGDLGAAKHRGRFAATVKPDPDNSLERHSE